MKKLLESTYMNDTIHIYNKGVLFSSDAFQREGKT